MIDTPNVLRYCKVCLLLRSLANLKHVKWRRLQKIMTDTTVLLSFCYASYCLCQFIIVEGGFLPSHPLTAHFFIVSSMANLPACNCNCRLYFQWKRVGDLQGGRDAFLEWHFLMFPLEDGCFGSNCNSWDAREQLLGKPQFHLVPSPADTTIHKT